MGSVNPWTANVVADVCVVGAGPAGLTIARELGGRGVSVCLVEAGDREVHRRIQRQSRGESDGYPIHRLQSSRVRALGGTLRHDGVRDRGWLVRPLDDIDFEERPWLHGSGWPFDRRHLDAYYARAATYCGVPTFDEDLRAVDLGLTDEARGLVGEHLEPTVFHRPPSPHLVGADPGGSPLVQLLLRTRVVDLVTDARGRRVEGVSAVRDGGQRVLIRADRVVLATGGIENARLLLLGDGGNGLGNQHDLVGRYFAERMLFTAGHLALDPRGALAAEEYADESAATAEGRVVALRVVDGLQREQRLHNAVLYLASRLDLMATPSGQSLSTLRKALGRRPLVPNLGSHVANSVASVRYAPTLVRRAVGRGRRVLVVGHLGEQAPNPESRVRLGSRRDDLGMPVARVTWQLTTEDHQAAERSVRVLGEAVRASGTGELVWTARLDRTTLVTGAHHHLGTTRMHDDPRQGVVDRDGRVHGVDNLYVAGSSVFPTYGASNPTLTIMAMAIRLADHLAETSGGTGADPRLTQPWAWTSARGPRAGAPREAAPGRRRAGR
jgi:choline dehydrogenase-like flavoprotein